MHATLNLHINARKNSRTVLPEVLQTCCCGSWHTLLLVCTAQLPPPLQPPPVQFFHIRSRGFIIILGASRSSLGRTRRVAHPAGGAAARRRAALEHDRQQDDTRGERLPFTPDTYTCLSIFTPSIHTCHFFPTPSIHTCHSIFTHVFHTGRSIFTPPIHTCLPSRPCRREFPYTHAIPTICPLLRRSSASCARTTRPPSPLQPRRSPAPTPTPPRTSAAPAPRPHHCRRRPRRRRRRRQTREARGSRRRSLPRKALVAAAAGQYLRVLRTRLV